MEDKSLNLTLTNDQEAAAFDRKCLAGGVVGDTQTKIDEETSPSTAESEAGHKSGIPELATGELSSPIRASVGLCPGNRTAPFADESSIPLSKSLRID